MEKMAKIFVLGIAAIAVMAIAIFFLFFYSYQAPNSQIPNGFGSNGNYNPDQNTQGQSSDPENERLWAMIDKPNVEKGCLLEAKREAGGNAWAVDSCSCSAIESDEAKFYSCQIKALDGPHPLTIDCKKYDGTCKITSEKGYSILTFAQL